MGRGSMLNNQLLIKNVNTFSDNPRQDATWRRPLRAALRLLPKGLLRRIRDGEGRLLLTRAPVGGRDACFVLADLSSLTFSWRPSRSTSGSTQPPQLLCLAHGVQAPLPVRITAREYTVFSVPPGLLTDGISLIVNVAISMEMAKRKCKWATRKRIVSVYLMFACHICCTQADTKLRIISAQSSIACSQTERRFQLTLCCCLS